MNRKLLLLVFFLLSLLSIPLHAQTLGCTDPQAINYAIESTINDGSCVYPTTIKRPVLISELPATLAETSGLALDEDFLWSHNDSGGMPVIYKIETSTGDIVQEVWIKNATNKDWEAISQDEEFLYIGDFGNNGGNRTDLKIYKINKSELVDADSVVAELIHFHYPEQEDFSSAQNNTAFDCEAFFSKNDSLYLFTKNWIDENTALYTLPKTPGTYAAHFHTIFPSNGLITDAAIDPIDSTVILLGYQENILGIFTPFAWMLFDFPENEFFKGNKRRIGLGTVLGIGQNEGVTLFAPGKGYISGEAIQFSGLGVDEPAKLSSFDFSEFLPKITTGILEFDQMDVILYPNPAQSILNLTNLNQTASKEYIIYDLHGRFVQMGVREGIQIDVSNLSTGFYFLKLGSYPIVKFGKWAH